MNSNRNSKFSRFVNGKGFYVALALCLVGAGSAAWVVVDRTLGTITESSSAPPQSIASSSVSSFPEVEEEKVGGMVTDIEIPSASSSIPQTPSSSSVAQSSSSASAAPSEQQALSPERQISAFVLPVSSAEVFNAYSDGELVKSSTLNKWSTHDGIDLKAVMGTQVMAVADGKVSRVYNNGIWGNTVEISHAGDLTSIYSGLAPEPMVAEGSEVIAGQLVGVVGDTNHAEAKLESHLHFAMQRAGKFVNPLEAMGKIK